jgi:hypothetical protein
MLFFCVSCWRDADAVAQTGKIYHLHHLVLSSFSVAFSHTSLDILEFAHDDPGLLGLGAAVQGSVVKEAGEDDIVVHLHT